ncbi:G5 domain-containing protein [Clostridium felsineum]|nr:G5 domain-containing protein [Clostridium felsineum]
MTLFQNCCYNVKDFCLVGGGIIMLEMLKSKFEFKFKLNKSNFKSDVKTYFSTGPKVLAKLMLLMLVIAIAAVMGISSMKKEITVNVDGRTSKIVTHRSNEKNILSKNSILVGPKDKIQPALDTSLRNGDKIYIKRAVNIEVAVDGRVRRIKSSEKTVSKMLKAEKIAISKIDKLNVLRNSEIKSNMKISITRVNSQIVKEDQQVDFPTEVVSDDNMGNDEKQVIQQGQAGQKEVFTKVVYEDGKAVSREVVREIVKKEPTKQIFKVGTLGVLKPDRGGRVLYKKSISALATAYTDDFGFGITASGTRVKRNSDGYSSIAVDPTVIPLGTKLYVPGYGYGIAEDTGGAIKGNRLDLFFSSEKECYDWGAKNVTVYIVK